MKYSTLAMPLAGGALFLVGVVHVIDSLLLISSWRPHTGEELRLSIGVTGVTFGLLFLGVGALLLHHAWRRSREPRTLPSPPHNPPMQRSGENSNL